MRRVKGIILVTAAGLSLNLAMPLLASAQGAYGGNNAADYQPPTGNPQSGATSRLQLNNATLQPVPGQTNFSQEKLPSVTNLKVAVPDATGSDGASRSQPASTRKFPTSAKITLVVGGLLTLAGVLYVLLSPSDSAARKELKLPKPLLLRPSPEAVKPPPAKKKTKKKKSKKKK